MHSTVVRFSNTSDQICFSVSRVYRCENVKGERGFMLRIAGVALGAGGKEKKEESLDYLKV